MWIIILCAVTALLCLSAFLRIRICIVYEEEFRVILKVLCFRFTLYPSKRKKIRLSKFKIKNFRKRRRRENLKALKKRRGENEKHKTKKKTRDASESDTGLSLRHIMRLFNTVVLGVVKKFFKYIRIDVKEIFVRVAGDDAANTALLYGAVSQSVSYALAIINSVADTSLVRGGYVGVIPDFSADRCELRLNVCFSMRVWHIIAVTMEGLGGYLKSKERPEPV